MIWGRQCHVEKFYQLAARCGPALGWGAAGLPSSKSDVGGKDHLAHKLGRAGKDKLTHVWSYYYCGSIWTEPGTAAGGAASFPRAPLLLLLGEGGRARGGDTGGLLGPSTSLVRAVWACAPRSSKRVGPLIWPHLALLPVLTPLSYCLLFLKVYLLIC